MPRVEEESFGEGKYAVVGGPQDGEDESAKEEVDRGGKEERGEDEEGEGDYEGGL